MITVDDKYKARPITSHLAQHNFEHGEKVLAIVTDDEKITATQIFYPHHHTIEELRSADFHNAIWYADWE